MYQVYPKAFEDLHPYLTHKEENRLPRSDTTLGAQVGSGGGRI